jgi:DNA-binding XRE family transcriptional regulator
MVETQQTTSYGTPEDDTARFLRELRQLRDYAGLGQAELAARAHYPREYITAAESGPAAPDLPLLSAYVRGCGGTVEDWEERWRALTNTPALPLVSTRSAGYSTAASAGARIGSISPAADIPDPAVIMAALNRVAEKIAASTPAARPQRSSLSPIEPFSTAQTSTAQTSTAQTSTAKSSTAKSSTRQSPVAQSSTIKPTAAAPAAVASVATGASNEPQDSTVAAERAAVGRRFGLTSRATVAALVALAICVIVAVLAIFA